MAVVLQQLHERSVAILGGIHLAYLQMSVEQIAASELATFFFV